MRDSPPPLKLILIIALNTVTKHYEYYQNAEAEAETPKGKALLAVLAESEAELIDQVRSMLYGDGIVEEIDFISKKDAIPVPIDTPFTSQRNAGDPRICFCNISLEMEMKAYTFFLSMATRAKSNVISHLFEYFAYEKVRQIEKIRRVCSNL